MNFSGISNRTLVGRVLRFPLRLVPNEATLPILQGRLRGKKWIAGSCNHGCWLGSYEYHKRVLFERTVTPGSVVFDLGAHVGFYSLLASVLVGPEGRVVAFEPVPENTRYLRRHLQLNDVHNVTLIEAAVSDRFGTVSFSHGRTTSMAHIAPHGELMFASVSLDGLIARGEVPIPRFLKIDIEGAELLALAGAESLLRTERPVLFLATHGSDVHRDCCRFLTERGYHLQPVDGRPLHESAEIMALPS